jgi:predicted AAA+ superfamily ATPase
MKLIDRKQYGDQLLKLKGNSAVKIITGIRRSGKSSIMKVFSKNLVSSGNRKKVVEINFDDAEYWDTESGKDLIDLIEAITLGNEAYLLLDEIQNVDGWERAIVSLQNKGIYDIYLTGSNSKLLSSELSTRMTGRYFGIAVKTLTFREFLEFRKNESENGSVEEEFRRYLRYGGFPFIHPITEDEKITYQLIEDVCMSIIFRDIVDRFGLRNIELLRRMVLFLLDNAGNPFSLERLQSNSKAGFPDIRPNTAYEYLGALENAFIIRRLKRYDIRGNTILSRGEKIYPADHSMVHSFLGYSDLRISGIMETILLNELEYRGYQVFTGESNGKEIDFVGIRGNERVYIQATYRMGNAESTIEREFLPLISIPDQYGKFVVSMDENWSGGYEGVKYRRFVDFLLSDEW